MAKMRIGTKTVTPVRNIPSYHGDDIIEILNNEDLSNALDGKVDKVSAPSVFYGTDSNGSQTTYDLSLLLDTETSPDGYTDVEYISSGNENVPMLIEKNISAQTSSFCGFEILDESTFFDYLENGLPGEVTWTVTRIRFVLEETNPNNVWYQYVNDANGEGSYNAGSIQEEDFESTCGIRPIYTSASARSLHDMATLEKVYSFGQYIDTGLVFENYEYGHAKYDMQSSQVGQYFQTWWVESKGAATQTTINQMSSLTGKDITRMKFVMTRTQSSTSVTLYAVDGEGNETSFNTFANDTACQDACGITMTWGSLNDGDYVYYDYYPKTIDTWGIETSLKISDQELTNTSNYICGSISQYGHFGCGLLCSENDGILFKHYQPNAQYGFRVPYNKGNWNKIKMEPGTFTLNGESFEVSTDATIHTVSGKTFILFGITREDGVKPSGMSMKKTKIYKNGILVFNGIPCVEDSSGIAGMYDLVTQQFFKSAKEGSEFIAGPLYEAEDKLNLGVKGTDVILGLNKEGNISTYSGKNGIVIESIIGLDDYEELEYIESTDGNLAFNTQRSWGMSGTTMTSTKWEITYYQTYTSAESGGKRCQYVFGDGMFTDMGQNFNRIDFRFYDGQGSFPYTSTSGNRGAMSADGIFMEELETWNTFAFDYQKLYLNNAVIKSLDYPIAQVVHSKNFHIFTAPDAIMTGNFGGGFIGRISRVKEFSSNTTLANFVPVRRKSDNEIGFYDTVNGIFCPNIGEGTPVAGPIKTGTISLSKSLDYVLENQSHDIELRSMIVSDHTPNATDAVSDLEKKGNAVFGINAFSKGVGNTIIGSDCGTTSDSDDNVVVGNNAHSYGDKNTSVGYMARSHSNRDTTIGYSSHATQENSTCVGAYAIAERFNSTVVGANTRSDGTCSVVVGNCRSRDNSSIYTVGSYTVAVGYGIAGRSSSSSVFVGSNINLNGTTDRGVSYGVAIGESAGIKENGGVVIGANARSYNENVVAVGRNTSAYQYAVAIGYNSIALDRSVVVGYDAAVIDDAQNAVAIGYNSRVKGNYGVNIGSPYAADGTSIAIGGDAKAGKYSTIAIGYNSGEENYNQGGNNNIGIGNSATVNGDYSVAIGCMAKVQNGSTSSVALGAYSKVFADYSIAIGLNSAASGEYSVTIGKDSSSEASNAVALGYDAHATGNHSVALGYGANTEAREAIQLGAGTNDHVHTLKFFDAEVLNSSAQLNYERLSSTTPQDGYVLTYSTAQGSNKLTWTPNGQGGGYVLPIASDSTLGGIKVGAGLSIDSETGILSATGGGSGGEGEGVWGQITGNIEDQTDLKEILDSKFDQVLEIPRASNAYNNKVLQYIGISDLLYKHGYVYECQYRKVSQITGYTSDESRFNVTFDVRRFEEYCKAYVELDPSEGTYYCDFDEGDNNWHISYDGSELFAISKNNLQYCGIHVDYSGANEPQTDDRVTMNYIKSTNEHAPFGYVWLQTNVQPGGNVVDNVTSTSTTDVLSANQGRVLQEQIDTLSSIGQFLAIWDCDTGTARYLDDGYQYTTGNYFIVGTKGTVDNTRSGNWSSEEITSTDNLDVLLDDITVFETKCSKVDRVVTFTIVTSTSIKCSYDNVTYTKMGVYNTFGIEISSKSEGTYTIGDQVIVTYKAPVTSYIPVGSEYDPVTGHETSTDDIEVSDMFFYDGENWILLANHSKQITIDQALDITSTNPVENRIITSALNDKVSKTSEANRVYGTTSLGEQVALTLGEDLQINEGELSTTIDLSTKQDVLVDSGEDQNIKTINGESILGSGNIIIQGGSGEGIGTINISNVFCKDSGLYNRDDYTDPLGASYYKGDYNDIFFTVNAPLDYVKEHRNDLYVTYSRRNQGNGIRKWRLLNDNRIKTNVKMYCWRFRTNQWYDSSFEVWKNDYDLNNQSDETYIYFYTTSDYNDDIYDMYNDNPLIWYSDLRHVGDNFEDDNFSQGCWGTCFNELTEYGNITDRWDDVNPTDVFERCKKHDITDVVMDTQVEYNPDNSNIWLDKMKGRLYQDNDGNKLYTWSNEWWLNNGRVFAYLDDNDEPIFNRIPSDMSKLSQICQVSQLTTLGYTLVEERPDLTYRRFNLNQTSQNIRNFVNNCRNCTTNCQDQAGNLDLNWRCYFWDYPVQPVRLAECKILFADEAPFLPGPDFPNDRFSDYTNRAYTLEEIEADEDLTYMLENQHQLIFVFPYDTYYLWMRTLGWTKMVYTHDHICSEWNSDEDYWTREISRWDYEWYHDEEYDRTYPVPKYDPDTGEQLKVRYEGDQGEDPNGEWLLAQAWDRHNLNRALFMGGQRNLGFWPKGTDMASGNTCENMGDFDNRCGILQGTPGYPRWSMRRGTKYFLPIQINIMTGKELSHGNTSKSTPFNVKLSITGNGNQSMYSD